ncbi:MAG: hypothetical protein ACFFGP_03965 [Promethearchaeota archaeon]
MTTYWTPCFHLYQPPTQDVQILKEIDKECYRPTFSILEKHDNVKFSVNINTILIEMLYEYDLTDSIELLKNLVSEKKVEVLGTAKYHPILPLIPEKEALHQIRMNEEINGREFNKWEGKGFFPPELSINSKVAKIVRDLGYKWVILSGIACPKEWPYDQIYSSPNGLQLFFRDDILSNKIAFNNITAKGFVKELNLIYKDKKVDNLNNTYVITAMDMETFGHHIKNYEIIFLNKVLELINDKKNIVIEFISNLDQHFPIANKKIIPRDSSWSTTSEDMEMNIPYPLWNHPENNIHKFYWKIMQAMNNLINLIDNLDTNNNWKIENYQKTARWFYDRSLHSCPTWWANPQRGIWSPNLIFKGVELIMKSALNAQLALVYADKSNLGEGYFDSITYYQGLLLMELYTTSKKCRKLHQI